MTASTARVSVIPVTREFRAYLENALTRFGYIRPSAVVEIDGADVIINFSGTDGEHEGIIRDFQFCLYREKIYAETFALRQSLIQGLMGK